MWQHWLDAMERQLNWRRERERERREAIAIGMPVRSPFNFSLNSWHSDHSVRAFENSNNSVNRRGRTDGRTREPGECGKKIRPPNRWVNIDTGREWPMPEGVIGRQLHVNKAECVCSTTEEKLKATGIASHSFSSCVATRRPTSG